MSTPGQAPAPPSVLPATPPPRLSTKLFYGIGAVPFGIKDQGFGTLLMLFYNQALGVPSRAVGLALMIALTIDAFIDPAVGYFSDTWRSRWGRRHPFMYASALPIALTYVALWHPPHGLSSSALFFYLLGITILLRGLISCFEIPSSAQAAELTTEYDQRTSFLAWRFFFGWVSALVMGIIAFSIFLRPTASYPIGQLNPAGYHAYGVAAAVVMLVTILLSSAGTHRHIVPWQPPAGGTPGRSLGRAIGEIFETLSERAFLIMFGAGMFGAMAAGLNGATLVYYGTYFWNLTGDQISVLISANFLSAGFALIIAPMAAKRFGKKPVFMVASISGTALGITPVLLRSAGLFPPNGSPMLVPLLFGFSAIGAGLSITSTISVTSMVADVVEQSQLRTGRRSEGLFFATSAFVQKCVSGIGLFISGVLLDLAGFPQNAQPGPQAYAALTRLIAMQGTLSLALYAMSLFLISRFPINRARHEANLRILAGGG